MNLGETYNMQTILSCNMLVPVGRRDKCTCSLADLGGDTAGIHLQYDVFLRWLHLRSTTPAANHESTTVYK